MSWASVKRQSMKFGREHAPLRPPPDPPLGSFTPIYWRLHLSQTFADLSDNIIMESREIQVIIDGLFYLFLLLFYQNDFYCHCQFFIKFYYLHCNHYHILNNVIIDSIIGSETSRWTCLSVGWLDAWSVSLSVIISLKGGNFHFR